MTDDHWRVLQSIEASMDLGVPYALVGCRSAVCEYLATQGLVEIKGQERRVATLKRLGKAKLVRRYARRAKMKSLERDV